MAESEVVIMVIPPHEVIIRTGNMKRLVRPKIIIGVPGEIPAHRIDRPGENSSVMLVFYGSGVEELQVIRDAGSACHPVVIGLDEWGWVVPCRFSFEPCLIMRQTDFYPPMGTGGEIHGSHNAAYAAVWIFTDQVVNRSSRSRCMANITEIKFNPS